ncbi:MAG: helix-turn-helix domain-containing protein, partial [Chloroflexi bacterium]|nr:helix-turn-helix domain-containing protein [Chloroflexota bacterium]
MLKKEGQVTYFIGSDSYFSHTETDTAGQRFALATLLANGHVRASEVEISGLGIAHRTLMHWTRQLDQKGPGSFYAPRPRRGGVVMTPEKAAECGRLLAAGETIAEVARMMGVGESTLRKAVRSGRVLRPAATGVSASPSGAEGTTKSERGRSDARAAEGMGTACTRADERMAAALGLMKSARTRFERCRDVDLGGLLAGLPALCGNGLLSGLGRHLSLPNGFYSALHILIILGFMALARIRRPEGLRHVPPGELGKVVGLDRVPEVRTLREKIALLADKGTPEKWLRELSRTWMEADPQEAGYLYVDGHVRVYHGSGTLLPRRYVSRERLCLRGTTDYWINDALGRPFFVVSKAVTDGLAATLLGEIVAELTADPLRHRFVVIFDREGSSHSLLSKLWERRIGAITYRKAVKDLWPESEFLEIEVPVPGGGATRMKLASRSTVLSAGDASIPVLEIRRLTPTGHQTAIITTARRLNSPLVAGRMFSRWCQENFFGYMMQHYDLDGLVQYGGEEIPGTVQVVNPAWRALEKAVKDHSRRIRKLHAQLGAATLQNDGGDIQSRAERLQDIQRLEADTTDLRLQRSNTPKKVTLASLPENERPRQLVPLGKMLTDTIKMIAYRAETALVGLLRPHLAKEEEARALVRELFVSSADLEPNEPNNTLTIRIHRMACPAHDKAMSALLADL